MSKALKNTISKATDSLNLSYSCICDLGTMFKAIQQASDEGSHAHELATIGGYLADDWGGMVDANLEEFKALGEAHETIKN